MTTLQACCCCLLVCCRQPLCPARRQGGRSLCMPAGGWSGVMLACCLTHTTTQNCCAARTLTVQGPASADVVRVMWTMCQKRLNRGPALQLRLEPELDRLSTVLLCAAGVAIVIAAILLNVCPPAQDQNLSMSDRLGSGPVMPLQQQCLPRRVQLILSKRFMWFFSML